MRSEKPADLLKLARALAASAEGMTLDEMAEFSKVGRRTVERRRDAVEDVFGPLDRIEDAEAFALQVGPRPYADPKILKTVREALLAGVMVKFLYSEGSDAALRWRKVIPYGLLFAPRFYLVARIKSKPEPVLFRLDRMHDLEVTDEPGAPPESFDLEAYALRSFGVLQEEAEDIVLRFDPSAAPDARTYLFHPTHTMTDEADGSLRVCFRAAGLLQIAHHLMTWGPTVAILAPDRLKVLMWEEVEALYEHYRKMRRRPRTAKAAAE